MRSAVPNVALVGVGGYGGTHYKYLKARHDAGKLRLSGVVIRPQSMEKYADKIEQLKAMGTVIYPNEDELIAAQKDKLDLICLPVGIETHRAMCCKALENGLNVLLEKPAAGCIADVKAMIEAEKKSGKFVAIGFHNMYGRDIHGIKNVILSGEYGKLKNIAFQGLWNRSKAYYRRNSWVGKTRLADGSAVFDSPINNAFAHYLNIALFCAGAAFRDTAHAEKMQAELVSARPDIETFDTCGVRVITSENVPVQVLMTHACTVPKNPIHRFDMERGSILWDSDESVLEWHVTDEKGNIVRSEKLPDWREFMFDDILDRLVNPDRFVYRLSNALEHTFCIERLHENFSVRRLTPAEVIVHADQDEQYEIPGINGIFQTGFDRNLLPSEAGAAWSTSAEMKKLASAY